MCKHLRGHIANTDNWFSGLLYQQKQVMARIGWLCWPCPFWWRMVTCFFHSWLASLTISPAALLCAVGFPSSQLHWGFSRITHPSCGAAHPMHLVAITEHSNPLVSHKLAHTLDPALLFSIYTSIFKLNNVCAISAQCPVLYFLQNFMDKIRWRWEGDLNCLWSTQLMYSSLHNSFFSKF